MRGVLPLWQKTAKSSCLCRPENVLGLDYASPVAFIASSLLDRRDGARLNVLSV